MESIDTTLTTGYPISLATRRKEYVCRSLRIAGEHQILASKSHLGHCQELVYSKGSVGFSVESVISRYNYEATACNYEDFSLQLRSLRHHLGLQLRSKKYHLH